MSEDGSWWRRLGAAFQPRSEHSVPAQSLGHGHASNSGRAHNAGVGFAAVSVRSTASHRQRRSALENVRTTSAGSYLATPSDHGPQAGLPPRSPSTPPNFQRKQRQQQQHPLPRSCPSSPPRNTQKRPRASSQQSKPLLIPHDPPRRLSTSPSCPGAFPQQRMSTPTPTPQKTPPPQSDTRQQTASPKSTPVRDRQVTIAEDKTPLAPQNRSVAATSSPSGADPTKHVLLSAALITSSGAPDNTGYHDARPGSPISPVPSKRSSSLPRPLSSLFSSPGSLRRHSHQSSSPSRRSPHGAEEEYYIQRTHGNHIMLHRRRASSTGSLAEAASLLATRNQYSATLSSLLAMGYPKQRAEEALWKHPTKAAAYLEHQDHAGQDILISDCEWCIPWLGLAHMIEVGSPPKPKPKPQAKPEATAPKPIEKPVLVEHPRESDGIPNGSAQSKQHSASPTDTEDSDSVNAEESTPTKRKSTLSQKSMSQASAYSQDTTTDSIVPVIGHANGENCQICKTAVGGVCQWSDWGWEHGRWEREFLNQED